MIPLSAHFRTEHQVHREAEQVAGLFTRGKAPPVRADRIVISAERLLTQSLANRFVTADLEVDGIPN